jgi:hypothetical protein
MSSPEDDIQRGYDSVAHRATHQLDSKFEALGVVEVTHRLESKRGLHSLEWEPARAWLAAKEAERQMRSDSRAEESLSISRKALSNSRLATRIAVIAITLSTIMAIQKIIEWYSK